MTEQDTTVLAERMHRLADDQAPQIDVVGQVRAARDRHRRQRRVRITVAALTTATAAVVVGTASAVNLLAAPEGQVAGPSVPPSETTAPETTAPEPTGVPADWEAREFQGVAFAVPPGARSADTFNDVPVSSWTDGPSLIWNGPHLGGDAYSSVSVMITEPFEGGLPPREGGRTFTVPGAEQAYGNIEAVSAGDGYQEPDRTIVWLAMLAGDRVVQIDAVFEGGAAGEQMAQHLIDSLTVSAPVVEGGAVVPAGWESRTFEGLTFAVPPGARAADDIGEAPANQGGFPTFVWNGPNLGPYDANSYVKIVILPPPEGEIDKPESYDWITVPGAKQAVADIGWGFYSDLQDPGARFNVTRGSAALYTEGRMISIDFDFAEGPTGEQMARDLIASLAVS